SVLSHSGSRPSSSRTTLARLSGSAMRSALISRIVILSTSSPTETGTMMVFMRLLLAARAPSLPEGRDGPCAAAPKNLRTPHPGANTASTVAGADCRRPGYPAEASWHPSTAEEAFPSPPASPWASPLARPSAWRWTTWHLAWAGYRDRHRPVVGDIQQAHEAGGRCGNGREPQRRWILMASLPPHPLWRMEQQFWLGDAAFHAQHLAPGALMVLPPPVGVLDRA